jgi:hypothetical protein
MKIYDMDKPATQEVNETAAELGDLLAVVQKMGRRLANLTHGTEYDLVLELNELLHEARVQMALIQDGSVNDWPTTQFDVLGKRA